MVNFNSLFIESKGQAVYFNGNKLIRLDKFQVKNQDVIVCSIESTNVNSGALQGFCIDVTGYAEMDGKILKKGKGVRLHFWEDSAPKQIKLKLFTKIGFVWVYNVCEQDVPYLTTDNQGNQIEGHSKRVDYGHNGAAMIVEEIENGIDVATRPLQTKKINLEISSSPFKSEIPSKNDAKF